MSRLDLLSPRVRYNVHDDLIGTTDQVDWTETPGSTAPNCSTGSFATLRSLFFSSVLVYDKP